MKNFEIKNVDCHASLAKTKSVQSGRSMIEMLGVLAIIGVLSVGGIDGYSKAMMKYRINKTIEQITLIAGNVRAFFAPQKNYEGLTLSTDTGKAIIQKAKLVPDEMWNENKTALVNAFGGDLYLSIAEFSTSSDNKSFKIEISGIPQEACIEILSQDWKDARVSIIVNTHGGAVLPPADIDKAIESCVDDAADLHFFFDNYNYKQDSDIVYFLGLVYD